MEEEDDDDDDDADDEMGLTSFRKELDRRGGNDVVMMNDGKNGDARDEGDGGSEEDEENDEFDGYDLRDAICEKWGECFDVEFQKVDSYGFRSVYLVSGKHKYCDQGRMGYR